MGHPPTNVRSDLGLCIQGRTPIDNTKQGNKKRRIIFTGMYIKYAGRGTEPSVERTLSQIRNPTRVSVYSCFL